MLWHFVGLLVDPNLVELFPSCPLLNPFLLDGIVVLIAADLVAVEFVVVIVTTLVHTFVAAVAAVGLGLKQMVGLAEDPVVVWLVAVVFPLVSDVGSSPHHP